MGRGQQHLGATLPRGFKLETLRKPKEEERLVVFQTKADTSSEWVGLLGQGLGPVVDTRS